VRGLLFGSLRGCRREWLRGDLVAGLMVWAVLVPEALAYASIAGVSSVVGPSTAARAPRARSRGSSWP
jgi:MFS superfamily sulfate permease-like transporter